MMPKLIPNKIPLRILIRESGKLFLCLFVGTLMISSLHDFDIRDLAYKAATLSTLFIFIFCINTAFLYYFDKKRSSSTERIWKKTFVLGYFCSLIFFFIHYFGILKLQENGVLPLNNDHQNPLTGWKLIVFILYANLIIYAFVFLIQNFVLHQYEKSRIQLELIKLKASNTEAANQLLQQQIQPHFLFNALNILKSLIRKEPKSAEAYLLRLSDFLRVSISKNTSGIATIQEELKVCSDYMEMQKIRFDTALQYEVNIDPDDKILQMKLPFFSLQPLLENAIKHNELTNENPLHIKIERDCNYIKVSNNLQPKQQNEVSTGNGHSMLKERYRLLSGESPTITIKDGVYSVSLKILQYEYCYYRR